MDKIMKLDSRRQNVDYFSELTLGEINSVNFNPIDGEGAMGRGVIIPPEESLKMKRFFNINHYNLLASDRIPLNRELSDNRMFSCKYRKYPENLPNTSVIIIFHNEAWSVLLRTIWSIINRTPKHLLNEIILVDDGSEREFLKDKLTQYIKTIPISIKIIRVLKRRGLVPARLSGARISSGNILTFFDSHCECSEGWAEPLLSHIKENPNTVISPVLDLIDRNNFSYIKNKENSFFWVNWNLETGRGFRNHLSDKPMKTPIMAGNLFSIDRNYFFKLRKFDTELKIRDDRNIEMTFRIWQCGGQVKIHPCSHVGHVTQSFPYSKFRNGKDYIIRKSNAARIALIWMDEWADFFLRYNLENSSFESNQVILNVPARSELRSQLHCKPFNWYLKNIWPDNFFPANDRFFGKIIWLTGSANLSKGYRQFIRKIKLKFVPTTWSEIIQKIRITDNVFKNIIKYEFGVGVNFCLQSHLYPIQNTEENLAIVGNCLSDKIFENNFVITDNGLIMTNDYYCLNINLFSSNKNIFNVTFNKCYSRRKTYWKYDLQTERIRLIGMDLCLSVEKNGFTKNRVIATTCRRNVNFHQKWGLIAMPWKA